LLRPLHPIHYAIVENVVWKLTTFIPLLICLVIVALTFDVRSARRRAPAPVRAKRGSRRSAQLPLGLGGRDHAFWTTRVHAVSTLWDRGSSSSPE